MISYKCNGEEVRVLGNVIKFLLVLVDIVGINGSMWLALWLRFDGNIQEKYSGLYSHQAILMTVVILLVFYGFNLYKSLWRYASVREMLQVIGACIMGSSLLFVMAYGNEALLPRSCYAIYSLVLTSYTVCTRFSYRFVRKMFRHVPFLMNIRSAFLVKKKRVMLVGAGEAASLIIKEYNKDFSNRRKVVLAVDDDKNKLRAKINGVRIKGTTDQLVQLAEEYQIQEIILAMPSASKQRIAALITQCNETGCDIKIFPGIKGAIEGQSQNFIRPVRIEDLLGRDEIVLDNQKLNATIEDQTILVTGGGGSIGSELCRQLLSFNPKLVIIFDIYENNAYDLKNELLRNGIAQEKIRTIIGSVRDQKKLREVFALYRPQMVFHAAAHKHVPLMEESPEEAIKNNVFGTLNTAQIAVDFGVKKFIMISTDKAVNPTNVMGATKRICEMIVQSINDITDTTDFVAVRFGNVLGSNGSVIPLFKKQLEAGGPLTVTHPEIIRYFMTIPEAVRLVLEASTFAKGGEIFVLDMGEPVKILDLAKNFIKLSGFEVDKDIQIKFTGLRPGEKLYEELLMSEEGLTETGYEKIFIGKPGDIRYEELLEQLEFLRETVEQGGDIREALMTVVPTYNIPEYNQQTG